MAKKKDTAVSSGNAIFADLAKKTGGDIISNTKTARYYIDTGSLALNRICSGKYMTGGIPGGRITEIYGPSSSSKSLVASNCLFGTQKLNGYPILLDVENASNPDFMKSASHLDIDRVIRYTPQSLEESFGKMYSVIKAIREHTKSNDAPILIVYDSISVSPSAREGRETDLPEDANEAMFKKIVGGKEQPGERAKICSKEFRKLTPLLEETNSTLLVLNQTREKIGVLYGSPETTGGGGNALPFYASLRLRTQTQKKIEHEKLEKAIGVNLKIKNVKNRSCAPFCESEGIQLLFANGINPISGLLSLLVQDERVKMTSAGRYTVEPAFAGPDGKVNFQAVKVNNAVPLQVFFDNPKLIDGESEEEVREYLKPYLTAMDVLAGADVVEKTVVSEEMDTAYDNAGAESPD
jgi:recombination protein RecA